MIEKPNMSPDLDSPSQIALAKLVRELPEDSLSMAWRSDLNEKLRSKASQIHARRRVMWFARPIAGLGFACALAAIVFFRGVAPSPATQTDPGAMALAAGLVDMHRHAVRTADIIGAGVDPAVTDNSGSGSSLAADSSGESQRADLDF